MKTISSHKIPILMYHEVTDKNQINIVSRKIQSSWILFKDHFEDQIAFLRKKGYESITLKRLIEYIEGSADRGDLPLKPVLITFDDGFSGNYQYAFPTLQKYGMVASFFVVVSKIGKECMLTWDQLREMNRFNMAIQSHTLTHPLLSCLGFKETEGELLNSKQIIQDSIGEKVDFISLPNGDYNRHYFKIAEECGFRGGCSSIYGFNNQRTNRFLLRRISPRRNDNILHFQRLLDNTSSLTKWRLCKSLLKRTLSRAVSKRLYDRIYNTYFGIES